MMLLKCGICGMKAFHILEIVVFPCRRNHMTEFLVHMATHLIKR